MHTRRYAGPLALTVLLSGCTTVGQVRNLEAPACRRSLESGVAQILLAQGENAGEAERLAQRTVSALDLSPDGPRPFALAANSGTDYHFIVQPTRSGCQLRLYGRVRGFTRVTNNLTWIESRPLAGCECSR